MATATKTSQKYKVYPLADRVAIRPMEETETMKGGLYIPDTAKEKPIQGEVIAVGPGRREKGDVVPMELKVGDRVVYGKYSGTDRKSTRLNSSHLVISYAVFCLKKKKHAPDHSRPRFAQMRYLVGALSPPPRPTAAHATTLVVLHAYPLSAPASRTRVPRSALF